MSRDLVLIEVADIADVLRQKNNDDFYISCVTCKDIKDLPKQLKTFQVDGGRTKAADAFTHCYYCKEVYRNIKQKVEQLIDQFGLGKRRKRVVHVRPNRPGNVFVLVNPFESCGDGQKEFHSMQISIVQPQCLLMEAFRAKHSKGSFYPLSFEALAVEDVETRIRAMQVKGLVATKYIQCLISEVTNCREFGEALNSESGVGDMTKPLQAGSLPGCVSLLTTHLLIRDNACNPALYRLLGKGGSLGSRVDEDRS